MTARARGAAALRSAADGLRAAFPSVPPTAVVIGSGLGSLEDDLVDPVAVAFGDLPGLPSAGVSGHGGRFVHGRLGDSEVLLQSGRFHLYEGHAPDVVVAPVRILAELGVGTVLMTNASGGIHPLLEPGDVVLVDDLLNLTFRSPLSGAVLAGEDRFPDMSRPLDARLARLVRAAAADLGLELASGTYAGVLGPQYETAAEIRMLSRLGADVVGMSTVPEAITAAARGLRCAVLSLVTNKATGLSLEPLSHDEVLETGAAAAGRVSSLVREVVRRLHGEGPAARPGQEHPPGSRRKPASRPGDQSGDTK